MDIKGSPHQFDEDRASEYMPRRDLIKTAILLRQADPDALVTIQAPFGPEVMKGDFYVVASPDGAYGAARAEFEASHIEIAPQRWIKQARVLAYQATEACLVETLLADGTLEGTVAARSGDWIVRQATGEVMVIEPERFAERYESGS